MQTKFEVSVEEAKGGATITIMGEVNLATNPGENSGGRIIISNQFQTSVNNTNVNKLSQLLLQCPTSGVGP